ncbi:Uncharacterized protein FWK35_00033677 [Aphis craccivora]|uniref:MADF domain-containing protein n=1 Tax=Aphis craccivora TaxID=307492 RepID=A0A6G0VUQ2_APHCR|nr:Uncharacterized protein FWK35_00033677 [Aphis craccivora]
MILLQYVIIGKICKARWNNIRDNYRKSIKKTTSGQAAKKLKKYKFDDQLQFLKPHLQERETMGNIADVIVDNEDVDIFNENVAVQSEENMNEIVLDGGEQLKTVEQTRLSKPAQKLTKKRSINTPDSASTTLMKYIMQKKESNMSNAAQNNPVDAFLAGLSPTLKKFTPYYLNLVKSKIFSVVQEYEMKMILDEEQKKKCQTVPYFTVSSPTYQNNIPNAAQNYNNVPYNHHAYVQVPNHTISPNTSYCSSAPPSPADLSQNISTQNLAYNIPAQNNHNVQEPRDIMTSTSHYLSSSPSPQFSKRNTQNHAYVQVPKNTISPNTSYCSSAPPSPADLSQTISLNATQNLVYNIPGPTDIYQ